MNGDIQDRHSPAASGGPVAITPDRLPDPMLIDSEFLLGELARIRQLALLVPFTTRALDMAMPINTVIDALWRLEQQLRYLLHLHREGQRQFARKAEEFESVAGLSASQGG